jgi:hypothetical protein
VVFQGTKQLFFEGYKLDSQGQPAFRYRLGADARKSVAIEEQPAPLRGTVAVGLARHLTIDNKSQTDVWLHVLTVPDSTKKVRVLDGKGKERVGAVKDAPEMPANDRVLVVPQAGEACLIVSAAAPPGVQWRWSSSGRELLLRIPRDAAQATVVVRIWSVPRDEPALLQEVLKQ